MATIFFYNGQISVLPCVHQPPSLKDDGEVGDSRPHGAASVIVGT